MNNDKKQQIAAEIVSKQTQYESVNAYRMANWNKIAEVFLCKDEHKSDGKNWSNPAIGELFRSTRALTNMTYRMLTAQRPFYMLQPNDIAGVQRPIDLVYLQSLIDQNMEYAKYRPNLKKAVMLTYLYGTGFVESQYVTKTVNFVGRKASFTTFNPRPLLNTAFSRSTYDIEEAPWYSFADVVNKQGIISTILGNTDKEDGYIQSAVNDVKEDKDKPEVNEWVNQRLIAAGYDKSLEASNDVAEVITYYGTLDTLGDGLTYCVQVVNRKHIIRIYEHKGIVPVRAAKLVDFELDAMGYGIGDMFLNLHDSITDMRQFGMNLAAFAGANMYVKQKDVAVEDSAYTVEQNKVIATENPADFRPLTANPLALRMVQEMEERLRSEYRSNTGATDTLQAIPAEDSTATEVSLMMNESVRNVSVNAEMMAGPYVKMYVQNIVENVQKYVRKPTVVPVGGVPVIVNPNSFLVDVNVSVKTMTDQDFRPKRLRNLQESLKVLTLLPQDKYVIDPTPILNEMMRLQEVPGFSTIIRPKTKDEIMDEQAMAMAAQQVAQQEQAKLTNRQVLTETEQGPVETLSTPVGEVLQAPGSMQESLANQSSASEFNV